MSSYIQDIFTNELLYLAYYLLSFGLSLKSQFRRQSLCGRNEPSRGMPLLLTAR